MTEYMKKTDKNGKARYYKTVDGKMKVVSRAEYEENTKAVPEKVWDMDAAYEELVEQKRLDSVDMTPAAPEDTALTVVKCVVSGISHRDEKKVKMQVTKHAVLINYRNCMVCSLVFDENHAVTAIRFMGTTLESRKQAIVREAKALSEYVDEIVEQIAFIDWWWLNSSKKVAA